MMLFSMATKQKERRIYTRTAEDFRRRVKAAAAHEGKDIEEWVRDALAEKLHRVGVSIDDIGPLAHLEPADRTRAKRFLRFLDRTPEARRGIIADLALDFAERLSKELGNNPT